MSQQPQPSTHVGDTGMLPNDHGKKPLPPAIASLGLHRTSGIAAQTGSAAIDDPECAENLSTVEIVALGTPAMPMSLERVCKRGLDVLGALLLALVFSPLIVGILITMLRSKESAIFAHKRVGRGGRDFNCLKFRTMVPNAEKLLAELLVEDPVRRAEWNRDQKLRDDPRATRLGRFLRRTSLDELPQIWNVLKNDMSLVGPRPVTREELLRYGRSKDVYVTVKPGITGLWQVSGRSNTDFRRRVAIDVCYVRNQGVLLDLWILAKTTVVVVGRRGAF